MNNLTTYYLLNNLKGSNFEVKENPVFILIGYYDGQSWFVMDVHNPSHPC